MLEFAFVVVPMLAFLFIIIDIAWAVFTRATLQYAVREGVRYAVTYQTMSEGGKPLDQETSIKKVVQDSAMGLLYGPEGLSKITIRCKVPGGATSDCTDGTNSTGNLMQVSVENYSVVPLAPLMRDATPLQVTAQTWARMEGNPPGGVPQFRVR